MLHNHEVAFDSELMIFELRCISCTETLKTCVCFFVLIADYKSDPVHFCLELDWFY